MVFHSIIVSILAIVVLSSEGRQYYNRRSVYPSYGQQKNCEIKSNGLKTIREVQEAIYKAKDGDIIKLDPIVYEGDLLISSNNQRWVSLVGDNQCHQNTVIRGKMEIRSRKWIINAIVFENSEKAIYAEEVEDIRLQNLVINEIHGTAIEFNYSNNVAIDNLVVDNVAKNALEMSKVVNVRINNAVISNVGGVAMLFTDAYTVELRNNVARNVVEEIVKTTGQIGNFRIAQTVISSDSPKGQGWMSLEGDNYQIINTVATGAPRNGIVMNGCNNRFSGNICTMSGYGYCIFLNNKQRNCQNNIGFNNLNIGGRGLYN